MVRIKSGGSNFVKLEEAPLGMVPKEFLKRDASKRWRKYKELKGKRRRALAEPFKRKSIDRQRMKDLTRKIKQEFGDQSLSDKEWMRIKSIAEHAAYEAATWYGITDETLDQNSGLVQNHVEYALFLGEWLGVGKDLPIANLDLRGIIDENGRINFRKVLEREAANFGLEAKIDENTLPGMMILQQETVELLEENEYHPLTGTYSLAAELRDILDTGEISAQGVYNALPKQRRGEFAEPMASLETAQAVHELLKRGQRRTLAKYAADIGLYTLGTAVRKKTKEDVPLKALESLVETEDKRVALAPEATKKLSGFAWENTPFDMRISEMKSVLEYLQSVYETSNDFFFSSYGSRAGTFWLAVDLSEDTGYTPDMKQLRPMIESGERLARLLNIEDERFRTEWHPHPIDTTDLPAAMKLVSHLDGRYNQKPELFFGIYGSPAAPIVLAKEFKVLYGLTLDPIETSKFLSDPQIVADILQSDDERFETAWNIQPNTLSLDVAEATINFFKHRYTHNRKHFFSQYRTQNGELATVLEREGGIKVAQSDLDCITGNGQTFSLLLGVNDARFEQWGADKFDTLPDRARYTG